MRSKFPSQLTLYLFLHFNRYFFLTLPTPSKTSVQLSQQCTSKMSRPSCFSFASYHRNEKFGITPSNRLLPRIVQAISLSLLKNTNRTLFLHTPHFSVPLYLFLMIFLFTSRIQ